MNFLRLARANLELELGSFVVLLVPLETLELELFVLASFALSNLLEFEFLLDLLLGLDRLKELPLHPDEQGLVLLDLGNPEPVQFELEPPPLPALLNLFLQGHFSSLLAQHFGFELLLLHF